MIYLYEDIDAVRKYYPNIPDDVFDMLIALDPTYNGKQSLGKYGKWILNLYNRGSIAEDELDQITPLLQQFTTYRNRIQNKDLNFYKSIQALSDTLAEVVDDDSMLTPRQKVRFLKNVKAGRVAVSAEDDYDIVLDTPKFTVYVPNTHEASMKLGKGTEWCTAHENPEWYNSYTDDGGKLYIVKDKSNGKRWQYSDKNGDFLDEDDEPFDVAKLMKSDKDLSKFFEKFLGIDYYTFDGTWVYGEDDAPSNIRSIIEKVIVPEGVTQIKDNAFDCFSSMVSIEIPDSVISIGEYAFMGCSSLESIKIPSGVKDINCGAFYNCHHLKSVELPNGVIRIGSDAFCSCVSLTNIEIPNSVLYIGTGAFNGCFGLEFINFPKGIDDVPSSIFKYCHNLKEIDISDATYIGRYAFYGCRRLEYVKLSDNPTDIEDYAFYGCDSLRELVIKGDPFVGDYAFSMCDNLTIYTDSKDIRNEWASDVKAVKPLSAKNESFNRLLKLKIKEDTCCIASKTSYIDEDGLDANGVYYFGKKPNQPISWREFQKKGVKKNMKIKESYYDMEDVAYDLLETKSVYDYDGFTTDYSLYGVRMDDSDDFHYYVCVFGDRDMYDPNEGSVDFDFETDDYDEALEWFDNYTGYEYDDEDEYDESYEYEYSDSLSEEYLAEDDIEEYGQFMQLDDVVAGFTDNMPEDDIDKAIKYLNQVSAKLSSRGDFSNITFYSCTADWLDPLQHKDIFDSFSQIYKNGKYDGYIGTYKGKKFVVDHFDPSYAFDMYAKDEKTIRDILERIQKEFD